MHAISRKARRAVKKETPVEPVVPFDNVGYQRWVKQREDWTTLKPNYTPKRSPPLEASEVEDVHRALGTSGCVTLPRPISLSEFIPILVEARDTFLY